MIPPRDTVVIGCSVGGTEALPRLLLQLPADLSAAVLIVQHLRATATSYLVDILRRRSQLAVQWAEHGTRIEHGRVLVAPPAVHLVLQDNHVQLSQSARESHSRPSIDRLFRSAAANRGSRVVGILLTGMLYDGVAGLGAIQEAGGVAIVQDPTDAAHPELPAAAVRAIRPDRVLPLEAIGGAIIGLVGVTARPCSSELGR